MALSGKTGQVRLLHKSPRRPRTSAALETTNPPRVTAAHPAARLRAPDLQPADCSLSLLGGQWVLSNHAHPAPSQRDGRT
jgi:hypothetical protein